MNRLPEHFRNMYVALNEAEEEIVFADKTIEGLNSKANGDFSKLTVVWVTPQGKEQPIDIEELILDCKQER